jgi:hypothetical protein
VGLESKIQESTDDLVIYPENGSRLYVEIADRPDQPVGMHIALYHHHFDARTSEPDSLLTLCAAIGFLRRTQSLCQMT